ncbi:hypothetical protein PAXRUDRAFT_101841, partial [Paxillus rubicundulus Ve08.2h10]
EKGRESKGQEDEKVAAATGPGIGAMDQTLGSVSLIKPTSSREEDLPGVRVEEP